MILRLCAPAIALALGAGLVELWLARLPKTPLLADIWKVVSFVPPLLLLIAVALLCSAGWRYWRWERGEIVGCGRCGGLLGRERNGRWGPYRKCLDCRKNESVKTYI